MKLISFLVIFASCVCDMSEKIIEFKVIKTFSERLKEKTQFDLYSYGVNNQLPKDQEVNGKIINFDISYKLLCDKKDLVSLDQARCWLVSVAESLANEMNTNTQINKELETFPLPMQNIKLYLLFLDENEIELGQGVCKVSLLNNKIRYQTYKIKQYDIGFKSVAKGDHYNIHEETYDKALQIVKEQGCLRLY